MSEKPSEYQDVLTPHDYDGIQEYDNPMPFWWKAVFVVTIIWSVFYVFAMELEVIDFYHVELAKDAKVLAAIRAEQEQARPAVTEEVILAAVSNADAIAGGQKVYTSTCASCHGPEGQGLIGPNLTDVYWLHGGAPMDVHKVIVEGVAAKGMPAWGNILSADDAVNVTAFLTTLVGTNPANPKDPQGDEYRRE